MIVPPPATVTVSVWSASTQSVTLKPLGTVPAAGSVSAITPPCVRLMIAPPSPLVMTRDAPAAPVTGDNPPPPELIGSMPQIVVPRSGCDGSEAKGG